MTDQLEFPRDDLLRPEVLAAFDRAAFERDGYWVWEGVLSDAGRQQWTASLQKLQQMNDSIVLDSDWATIDFAERGLRVPRPDEITADFLASRCGGSEQMPRFLCEGEVRDYMHEQGLLGTGPALAARGFTWHGVMPEYFPGAYDEFTLDVITAHPQMMELLGKLLGERFLLDHCYMLNRPPGSRGRRWHGHPYREGQYEVEDPIGTGHAVTTEYLQQQCIRTLCYTEGAEIGDGGELAVIPGAHLYRIPFKWSTERPDDDASMQESWLQGKTHAVTGQPLEIVHLSLSPGSMVSFVHHMPHYVAPRHTGGPTRWGLLMAYRTPDAVATPARWTTGVPTHWVERTVAAGALSTAARRVFEADNPVD